MNASDARKAHRILSRLFEGRAVPNEEREFLRNALPERPRQKTLEEICEDVALSLDKTSGDQWEDECVCLESWLTELHAQLKGLKDAPATVPALPAGMRLADHEEYGRVVVSPNADENNLAFRIFYVDDVYVTGSFSCYVETSSLTFIDADPAKPAHPAFLETEKEYSSAPPHTVVSQQGNHPWIKLDDGTWLTTGMDEMDEPFTGVGMSRVRRRVLRWGEQA